jgi:4-hydroxybenzoate polyprenyltransferase
MIPNPLDLKNEPYWVYKGWAFLWLIRFIPSSVASLAILAGLRLSGGSNEPGILILVVLSTFAVTSGCSAWNDYCDQKVDVINLPYRPLPSGILSPRLALYYAIGAFFLGNILALCLGFESSVFFSLATLTSIAYSPLIKKLPVAKNLYVGIYCASLLVFGGYLGRNMYPTLIPALITVICLVARELLMDIHDLDGDKLGKYPTLPIAFGIDFSQRVVAILLGLTGLLQLWLLSGLMTSYFAMGELLISVACFWCVAIYVSVHKRLPLPRLLSQIRLLMAGVIMGVLALTF